MNGIKFHSWIKGFSGCDGGDIGNPESRSVWVCGIEWGGGHTVDSLLNEVNSSDVNIPPMGYNEASENLKYPFNRNVMKLLAAVEGCPVRDYSSFAYQVKPFIEGSQGYCKMNLYPVAFKDTNQVRWTENFAQLTGFKNKADYIQYCRSVRFPIMNSWVRQFKPKLIVCFGKTYVNDFKTAFLPSDVELRQESIEGRDLFWAYGYEGVLVAICPFPLNRYGLASDNQKQAFGSRIKELLDGC